ncbi:hypothetical protein HBB16_06265 [Pseudonocardia sp. MCCB 268]|nr:hypothetical protein [Pseudonocardia cytotoxica]
MPVTASCVVRRTSGSVTRAARTSVAPSEKLWGPPWSTGRRWMFQCAAARPARSR